MPSCAIITCKARSQVYSVSNGGISFHRFPRDPDLLSQWVSATGRRDWTPTRTSTICSMHFCETDYSVKKSGKKFLLPGAVPHEKVVYILHSVVNPTPSTAGIENESSKNKFQVVQLHVPTSSFTKTAAIRKLEDVVKKKDAVIMRQCKVNKKIQGRNQRLHKKVLTMIKVINDMSCLKQGSVSSPQSTKLQAVVTLMQEDSEEDDTSQTENQEVDATKSELFGEMVSSTLSRLPLSLHESAKVEIIAVLNKYIREFDSLQSNNLNTNDDANVEIHLESNDPLDEYANVDTIKIEYEGDSDEDDDPLV